MSTASIYAAQADGEMYEVAEYRNSWGGAAAIWSHITGKVFGSPLYWMTNSSNNDWWKEARQHSSLTDVERLVFIATFDDCLFHRDSFLTLAKAFEQFAKRIPFGNANHLPAWANQFRLMHADEAVLYAGFHATSVCECPWVVEEDQEYRPYNVLKDNKHWMLHEDFPEELSRCA